MGYIIDNGYNLLCRKISVFWPYNNAYYSGVIDGVKYICNDYCKTYMIVATSNVCT